MLLVELALQGFLHLTVELTKVYLLLTTGLEKADDSPQGHPLPRAVPGASQRLAHSPTPWFL